MCTNKTKGRIQCQQKKQYKKQQLKNQLSKLLLLWNTNVNVVKIANAIAMEKHIG
jgi:hypothetical protein